MTLKRSGRIKPKKRTPAEKDRIYGSPERIAFLQSLRCACGCGVTPCEVAHVANGGMSRKGDAESNTIPLATKCHAKAHAKGWESIGLTKYEAAIIALQVEHMWERRNG